MCPASPQSKTKSGPSVTGARTPAARGWERSGLDGRRTQAARSPASGGARAAACSRPRNTLSVAGGRTTTARTTPDDAGLLLQAASAAGRAALGKRAGRRAQRIRTVAGRVVRLPPRCAAVDGYNVHAGVVVGGHDEEAVERLCRYVCRPALAKSRIEEAPGGGVVLRFKRPWSDGTTGLRLTDLELVQRLAALVPPPHANMVFYHGVFGPSAAWRDQVVPTRPEPEPSRGRLTKRAQGRRGARTGRRWPWSDLLWHVFGVDGFRCPRCGERMVVRSVVIYPPATRRVLGGLARAAARAPPAQGAQAA